ncbi:MAG: phosphatidylserine decarboxylase family protein [Ignavibacteria bacterium]|nr:phosphatidylserine decarboxylase family protein [Ignavibacteria bacterium]
MITHYGYDNAFLMLAVGACFILLTFTPVGPILTVIFALLGVVITAFTLWFFRDSERPVNPKALANPRIIVAPADGKVMEITNLEKHSLFSHPVTHITIFLSPVNLHVNRYPMSGTITHAEYIPGKYLMAFEPKASEENERSVFLLASEFGTIMFTQITGFLARRIVYDTKRGDVVRVGDRFGMMKFGSRMDVIVPATAEIHVQIGQSVRSSDTLLATLTGNVQTT